MKFSNPYSIIPPGANDFTLSHPKKSNSILELAIFNDHRFAFFYWNKWTQALKTSSPPCLVSLDWHQDLCYPSEQTKKWLNSLDLKSAAEVALFTWSKLAGNNDNHILSAAYLNLIGDVFVHCRQEPFEGSWEDEEIIDLHGNTHTIKKFSTPDGLERHLRTTQENQVYFDIDLDFFVLKAPDDRKVKKYSYMTKKEIVELLSRNTPMINWIFERLAGFTIATEPECCGGLLKSNRFLSIISELYFEPELFAQGCDWKHM